VELDPGRLAGQTLHRAHRRPEKHVNPVLAKVLKHLLGNVGILPREERLGAFDDRNPAAEPTEHLRELAADVAAPQDDEVVGQAVEFQDGITVKRPRFGKPGHCRQGRAGSCVEEHLVGGQLAHAAFPEPDFEGARPREAGRADQQRHAGVIEVRLIAPHHLGHHGPLPVADPDRVGAVEFHADAEVGRPAGELGYFGRLDHRLGGDAGNVDATSADHPFLDHDDPTAGGSHLRGQGFAALAPANDGNLEMFRGHGSSFSEVIDKAFASFSG
jgi:hypothetical protein